MDMISQNHTVWAKTRQLEDGLWIKQMQVYSNTEDGMEAHKITI